MILRRVSLLAILTVLATTLMSPSPVQANGSLDLTFSGDGWVNTHVVDFDEAMSVAVQSGGEIVVAGYTSGVQGNHDFVVARYKSNGNLDTTFGTDGIVTTDFGGNMDIAFSVALQTDGKILVAGRTDNSAVVSYGFAIARYKTDGSLDTSFDTDGKVTTNISSAADEAYAMAVQADGKIVVVGNNWAGARYNTDGSLDTSFGTDGKIDLDPAGGAESVEIQSDGKIVLGGTDAGDFSVVRLNTDGSLDTSFDTDGKVTTDFGGTDNLFGLAIQTNGKILAGGHSGVGSDYDFAVARYNTDGSLDTSFGTDGKVTTDFGGTTDMAQSGDDSLILLADEGNGMKIILVGRSNSDLAIARYNTDGSLDTTFNGDGLVIDDLGPGGAAKSVASQANGKIVVGGRSNGDLLVARYWTTRPFYSGTPFAGEFCNSSTRWGTPFADVGNLSPVFADVGCLYHTGVVLDDGSDRYRPDDVTTRAEMITFAARTLRPVGGLCPSQMPPFVDVDSTSTIAGELACMYGLAVVRGRTGTTFDPDTGVTRGEAAAIISRFYRAVSNSRWSASCSAAINPFEDTIGHWSEPNITCVHALGIITGTTIGAFSPEATVTRAEAATMWKKTLVSLL